MEDEMRGKTVRILVGAALLLAAIGALGTAWYLRQPPGTGTITVSPTTAPGSQETVDRGKLVTWTVEPTCVIAGHDFMGWAWLNDVKVGRVVEVTTGPCRGRYVVTDHRWQKVKGGPIPSWMSDDGVDLVLQTCTGLRGMGFTILRRA